MQRKETQGQDITVTLLLCQKKKKKTKKKQHNIIFNSPGKIY